MRYQHYYSAGVIYGLTSQQVSALVRKHKLARRNIWGHMAVDSDAWDKLMKETNRPIVVKGYKKL